MDFIWLAVGSFLCVSFGRWLGWRDGIADGYGFAKHPDKAAFKAAGKQLQVLGKLE